MKCPTCQSDTPTTSKFCASCGKPIATESDFKTPADVTLSWLKSILDSQGYSTEVRNEDPNTIISKHKDHPNLIVTLKPGGPIITLESPWILKGVSWSQKKEFLQTINLANSINWLCTCFSPEPHDSLQITTYIYLTERISSRDILSLIDMFNNGIYAIFEKSGIKKFS